MSHSSDKPKQDATDMKSQSFLARLCVLLLTNWSTIESVVWLIVAVCLIGGRCLVTARLIGPAHASWFVACIVALTLSASGVEALLQRCGGANPRVRQSPNPGVGAAHLSYIEIDARTQIREDSPPPSAGSSFGGELPTKIAGLRGAVSWRIERNDASPLEY